MGGIHSKPCNDMARDIWLWCATRHIWLSASHIPGRLNVQADLQSRRVNIDTEWMLKPLLFRRLCTLFFTPDIDLFASRLNHQLPKYVSWKPDPAAHAVDAYLLPWNNFRFYAFPPFSQIGRVLQKVHQDQAEGLLVVPNWPTQQWFPNVMSMLVARPLLLPPTVAPLQDSSAVHPLHQKMSLLVCHLSGDASKARAFRTAVQQSFCPHGDQRRSNSINPIYSSGSHTVVKGTSIHFRRL